MPIMDGYRATQSIRHQELRMQNAGDRLSDHPNAVIIALTASSLETKREEMLNIGCDDVLRKPFVDEELFDVIGQRLGVRFRYEESERLDASAQPGAAANPGMMREAIAALPAEWRAQLATGATEARLSLLTDVIARIRERDAALADALTRLVDDFRYDEIVTYLPPQNGFTAKRP